MATVLVTGSARGLGAELTKQYAESGWEVIACARQSSLISIESGSVEPMELDVTDEDSISHLANTLGSRTIDVLINCAGTMGSKSFANGGLEVGKFGTFEREEWENVMRVNLFGPMRICEALVDNVARSEQKKMVTLSSIVGSMTRNSAGGLYAYRASKAAVNAIMRSMSIDLATQFKIIAIPLHPGWVRTDMGGGNADIDLKTSVTGMRHVIEDLTLEKTGRFWVYDGSELPW